MTRRSFLFIVFKLTQVISDCKSVREPSGNSHRKINAIGLIICLCTGGPIIVRATVNNRVSKYVHGWCKPRLRLHQGEEETLENNEETEGHDYHFHLLGFPPHPVLEIGCVIMCFCKGVSVCKGHHFVIDGGTAALREQQLRTSNYRVVFCSTVFVSPSFFIHLFFLYENKKKNTLF